MRGETGSRAWWRTRGLTRIRVTSIAVVFALLVAVPVAVLGYAAVAAGAERALFQTALTQTQGIAELLRSASVPAGYVSNLPYEVSTRAGDVVATSGDYRVAQEAGAIASGSWNATGPRSTDAALSFDTSAFTIDGHPVSAIDTYVTIGAAQADAAGLSDGEILRVLVFQPSSGNESTLAATRAALTIAVIVGVVLSAVAVWFGVGGALRPVARLNEAVRGLRASAARRPRAEAPQVAVPRTGDEVEQLADNLNALLHARIEVEQQQRDFVNDAAHELRTPVASLLTTLEVAQRYPDSVDAEQTIAAAIRQAQKLDQRVNDLLLLARLEETPDATVERVDIVPLLADALPTSTETVEMRWVTAAESAFVDGTPDVLGRLFENLLTNASRHARSTIIVTLRQDDAGAEWIVEITNDGPEILPADQTRIFERFVRLDPSRPHTAGTGLGLPIARRIAERHGGSLSVRSAAAETTFTVRLPALP